MGLNQPNLTQRWPAQPMNNFISRPYIPGRMINSIEEVMPNEVPMDGNISLFVKNDYSSIYAKAWNSDGTITTVRFVREDNSERKDEPFAKIMERLDNIEKSINKNQNRGNYQKPKKEDFVDAN